MPTSPMSPVAARSRRARRLRCATVAALGAALAVPVSAGAAGDQYLRLSGTEYRGESRAQGFVDAIDVHSASFDIKRAHAASAPTFGHLTITKYVDRASPALMLAAAGGGVIRSALLSVRNASAAPTPRPYLEYCFENVAVTSDQLDTASSDYRPLETVAFSYQRVTQSYAQPQSDGTLASPIVAGWSLIQPGPVSGFPTGCGR